MPSIDWAVNIVDAVSVVATIVLTLVVAWVANSISQKQLTHAVMISCIERFQNLIPKLKDVGGTINPEDRQDVIEAYIDLCNEEIFYFKQKYIDEEVQEEWLDGMIEFLPLLSNGGKMKYDPNSIAGYIDEHKEKLLKGYRRIKRVFTVDIIPVIEDGRIKNRQIIVEQLQKNVKNLPKGIGYDE